MRALMLRIGIILTALTVLSACATKMTDSHGYVPDDTLLNELMLGLDTKETTARLLGRPGAEGIVDEFGWYYVRSDYERFLWRKPVETDREVVAVSFAQNGTVQNVERFGLEEGRVVALSRRVTTPNTRGVGFLRQLFSNLGNFDAGNFLEDG